MTTYTSAELDRPLWPSADKSANPWQPTAQMLRRLPLPALPVPPRQGNS